MTKPVPQLRQKQIFYLTIDDYTHEMTFEDIQVLYNQLRVITGITAYQPKTMSEKYVATVLGGNDK